MSKKRTITGNILPIYMEKPEIVQTKFQKILATVAKASFWIWLFTISAFVAMTIYGQKNSFFTNYAYIYLGNIGVGVVAFIFTIVAYLISRPRPKQETDAIFKTLGLGITGLILLVVLGRLPTSTSGSVNGARLFASPLPPITTNTTPQPTPPPKANTTTTLPKSPQITCTGSDYKTFQTTEAECIKFRTAWGLSPSNTPWPTQAPQRTNNTATNTNTIPTSTYKPTVYPVCTVYYPTINFKSTYYYMTAEECAEANKNATANVPTPTPTPIVDIAALISQCKANVDAKYYPIFQRCNSYDAATHQFCYETSTNSKNAEYAACNSIGN